jgi:hypothetical protein
VAIGALVEWTGHYEAGFLFMAFSAAISACLVMMLREPERRPVEVSA